MDAARYKPDVTSVWVADETMIDLDGKNVWSKELMVVFHFRSANVRGNPG